LDHDERRAPVRCGRPGWAGGSPKPRLG